MQRHKPVLLYLARRVPFLAMIFPCLFAFFFDKSAACPSILYQLIVVYDLNLNLLTTLLAVAACIIFLKNQRYLRLCSVAILVVFLLDSILVSAVLIDLLNIGWHGIHPCWYLPIDILVVLSQVYLLKHVNDLG